MPSPSIQVNDTFDGTPASVSFLSDNVAGNTIVVCVAVPNGGVTATGVTDSNGNSYSQIVSSIGGDGKQAALYAAIGILAGPNTVTVTVTSGDVGVVILEYPPSSGVRTSASAQQSGGASDPTVPIAGTVSGDIVSGLINSQGAAQSPGSIGTNPSFITDTPVFGLWTSFDGISSGGSVLAGTTGATLGWNAVVLDLAPVTSALPESLFFGSGTTS